MSADVPKELESRIERWREFVAERPDSDAARVEDLDLHLREDTASLTAAGLTADEAFLVALKRAAARDAASAEFARTYSEELWAPSPAEVPGASAASTTIPADFAIMLGCAVAAAAAIKLPELLGYRFGGDDMSFYLRNLSLFVLPFLALYFGWTRGLPRRYAASLVAVFVAGAVFANVYPFKPGGSTEILTALHLPVVLWLTVGVAFVAGDWLQDAKRMEFVRFTGEWLVTYALIALGGGVLTAITIGVFDAIGLNATSFMGQWVLPCGAMGAVVVAAWLVEARRNLVGGMAPMLARVFTPLFALMLVALLVGVIATRGVIKVDREVLLLFDLLLVVVVALVLYSLSARDPDSEPDVFDAIQLALVGCALAVDVFALVNIVGRLSEYGSSANRLAVLGLNLVLLVNLAWAALLQTGYLRRTRTFAAVERWQMRYLPVYALWAAIVVVVFPPLFHFA